MNEQQAQFCEEYVKSFNAQDAYTKIYNPKNKNVAAVCGKNLLRLPKIIDRVKELEGDYRIIGHKIGINRKVILERLKILMEENNLKAIELILKIIGDMQPEEKEKKEELPEIDVSKLNLKQRNELKQKILKSI